MSTSDRTTSRPSRESESGSRASDGFRALGHLSFGGGAIVLGLGGWLMAVAFVVAVLAFNLLVLPRLGGTRFRRADETHPWFWGAVSFPLSILVLLLLLPSRPEIVTGVWVLVAVGDSLAGVVGARLGARLALAWNPRKSWPGTLAYAAVGGGAAAVATRWIAGASLDTLTALVVCMIAAVLAGVVEAAPGLADDNLAPGLFAAFALWVGLAVRSAPLAPRGFVPLEIVLILALHGFLGWILLRLGAVDRRAAVVGAALGASVLWSLGWRGWLPLVTMIGAGLAATRFGLEKKIRRGTAEQGHGRRSAGQIVAKGGWAAALACVAAFQPGRTLWLVLFCGALAAAAADTLATEIGGLRGGRAFALWKFRRCAVGTPGAVTLLGTLAALVGASAVAAVAAVTLLTPGAAAAVALAGVVATMLESLLAPPLETVGLSTHTLSNLLLTMIGAALAGVLAG